MSRVCPKCKTKTYVSDTRYRADEDYTYRRHECQNKRCGFVFSTAEVVIADDAKGKSLLDRLRESVMQQQFEDIIRARRLAKELLETLRDAK